MGGNNNDVRAPIPTMMLECKGEKHSISIYCSTKVNETFESI